MPRMTGGKIQGSCLYSGPSALRETAESFRQSEFISYDPSSNILLVAEAILLVNNIAPSNNPHHDRNFSLVGDPTKDEPEVFIGDELIEQERKKRLKEKPELTEAIDKFQGSDGDQQKDHFFDQDDPPSDNYQTQIKRTKVNHDSSRQMNYFLAKSAASSKSKRRNGTNVANASKNRKYTMAPTKKKTEDVDAQQEQK